MRPAGRRLDNDPERNSLGLLPSGPDPVGEATVRRQPPDAYIAPQAWGDKWRLVCRVRPMLTRDPIPLTDTNLDRAGHHRGDSEWLDGAARRDDALILLMQAGQPLVSTGRGSRPLAWLGPPALALAPDAARLFLGKDKAGAPVFALNMPERFSVTGSPIEGLGTFEDMRAAAALLPGFDANASALARSIFEWHRTHGFCARCGGATDMVEAGWKRHCPACGAEHFPRVDPVAIMLAVRGDQCLLGRSPGWPAGFFSCLAGYVEPGETVEQAAARELFEEAGIKARAETASYLFGQPWPFPSSLMIGVLLEADTMEITVDPKEIEAARWFSKTEARAILAGEHPDVYCPPEIAVAHHILKHWAANDENVY